MFSFEFHRYIGNFNDHIEKCYEIMLYLGQRSTSRWLITFRGKVRINKGGVFSVIIMRRCHIVSRKLNKMLKSGKGEEKRKKIE